MIRNADVCVYYCSTYYKAVREGGLLRVCVYYCSTHYKAVRESESVFITAVPITVCVFITAGPIIKLCAGGEGDREG